MSDALSKARAALANVTPGPWGAADGGSFGGWWISLNGDPSNVTIAAVPIKLADADHIATFDPPTVLAMLDAIEAVQAAVATEVYDGAVYCRSCGSWVDADTCLAAEARTKIARVYTLIGDDDE